MVLVGGPFLEQLVTAIIEDEDRYSPVEAAVQVDIQLWSGSNGLTLGIHQLHQRLHVHIHEFLTPNGLPCLWKRWK
jgi:hypothetical protein